MYGSIGRWRRVIFPLFLACYLLGMTSCAARVQIVPDSREVISLENGTQPRPGWYGISGGYLRELYRADGCERR